ncbi:lysophospholipase [Aureococcus anophagefferens]|nr:lysophospholipase [Aureococcus anophagefferens]
MAVGAALLFLLVARARALTAHATRLRALRDWAVASEALPVRSALTSLELGERSKRASALRAALDETYDDLRTLEAAQDAKPERARQTFDVLDRDADGAVTLDDVLAAATRAGKESEISAARFAEADADASGALDFDEFETYWRSQQRHQDGDLASKLTDRAADLETLVELSLELTAAALDTKLVASLGGAGQPGELSAFVDEWCAVDAERRALPRPSVVRTDCRSFVDDREALLQRAGKLADDLQVADPGAARSPVTAARRARDAAKSAKGMFGFVGRGMRIMGADVARAGGLAAKGLRKRGKLAPQEGAALKRTVTDVVTLVPYGALMAIPLSPPGHVSAFTLLQKMGAPVPSSFTAQRQEVGRFFDAALSTTDA